MATPESPSPDRAFEELACGALAGEPGRAFGLFERAWPRVVVRVGVFLRSLGVAETIREDCGQNALTRVWRGRAGYRGSTPDELWAWIYRIVQREAYRLSSVHQRIPRPLTDLARSRDAAEDEQPDEQRLPAVDESHAGQALVAREEQRALEECMAMLDERERAVVELCYAADAATEREAAALLGVSKSWVNVLRQRALDALHDCLTGKGVHP